MCCGDSAGSGPDCGEETRAHRREGLWVAAPHPVRPLSHTHPPRGALLDLTTVRGLAAAPQQKGLLLRLRLQRRLRSAASTASPPRAPGRCSGARAASARDRGKRWNQSQIPPPRALRTRRTSQALPHGPALLRALRTRDVTGPAFRRLKLAAAG